MANMASSASKTYSQRSRTRDIEEGAWASSTERVRRWRVRQAQILQENNSNSDTDHSLSNQEEIVTEDGGSDTNNPAINSDTDDMERDGDDHDDDDGGNSGGESEDSQDEEEDSEGNDIDSDIENAVPEGAGGGISLRDKLCTWAIHNHCGTDTVNGILQILREEGLDVPKDRRTLLETIRSVPVVSKAGGEYIYLGVGNSLKKVDILPQIIRMKVNIDGIPIYKSKKLSLWPICILCDDISPLAVALWYGKGHPDVDEYLKDFIDEMLQLLADGLTVDGHHHPVTIDSFICDAPARALLKGIVHFNGYHSCERCTIHGEHLSNRVVYSSREVVNQRSDQDFLDGVFMAGLHPHQLRESPLAVLRFPMVTKFTLDYMHLVCLGVQKRLLSVFKGKIKGIVHGKLSQAMLDVMSSSLLNCRLPSEFNRQPRSLEELDMWKATEFRSFLLYTGMVVLKTVVSPQLYRHFVSFSLAIRMLCEEIPERRNRYIPSARNLLEYFVWNAQEHYGPVFTVYNVHGLLHLPDDVYDLQHSLDELSAFPFENYLGKLKKLVKGQHKPLVEIVKRLDECSRYKSVRHKELKKVDTVKNAWFQVHNGYFEVKEVRQDFLIGNVYKMHVLDNLFTDFIPSKDMGIVVVKRNSAANMGRFNKLDLIRKCVCVPYKDSKVVVSLLNNFN